MDKEEYDESNNHVEQFDEEKEEDNNHDDESRDNLSEDDSSEEDEEDNPEEIQKIQEGFINDEDEEEQEEVSKRKKRRKRNREKSQEDDNDDALDQDDLELLLENTGQRSSSNKLKRLKRRADSEQVESDQEGDNGIERRPANLQDIFSDESETEPNMLDEFEDFIEEDVLSDDEANRQREVRKKKTKLDTSKLSSEDKRALSELFEIFGDGSEYQWALEAQDVDDVTGENNDAPQLDSVFEHAELKERMLTDEDNLIRIIDIPERYQKYRGALTYIDLNYDDLKQEKDWIGDILYQEKRNLYPSDLELPFKEAVGNVVEFISQQSLEVPFIWSHRRDFLLYSQSIQRPDGQYESKLHKLLYEDDLWRIVQLDIEFHSFYEKRINTEKLIDSLGIDDDLTKDIKSLNSMVAIQDLYDYIQFTYSKQIRHAANNETETLESKGKKHSKFAIFERIKDNILYEAVRAFGITAKQFGENVQDQSSQNFEVPYRIHATDDTYEKPNELIERLLDDVEVIFKDLKTAKDAIRRTFAEEIFHNPKIRQEVRKIYKQFASISVAVTEKGKIAIDDHSPFADIKYAINREPIDLISRPDVLLRMLEAEKQGLAVIKVDVSHYDGWYKSVLACLKSDGSSSISDEWNKEREVVLKMALKKLCGVVALNTKEDLRRECERLIAADVRKGFMVKVDQAPYTPIGYDKGTKPNVLVLTFGKGEFDSAVVGVMIKDSGKVQDFFKSDSNPTRYGEEPKYNFINNLKEYFDKTLKEKPDVIVIAGFNANSKKLFDIIQQFIKEENLLVTPPEGVTIDPRTIPIIWGEDETARLFQNSERAITEFADKSTLVRYAIGVGRYIQNPLLEYVALGEDILSLSFHHHQKLISDDLVKDAIESVFVDIVNMVGVEINLAAIDPYYAQLLPYIAGLGPRKASGLLRSINTNLGSYLATRSDLIENELTTSCVFMNCSSFLIIPNEENSNVANTEILDGTRIHPEDYALAKKMAADALDLDEEDVRDMDKNESSVINQLINSNVNKIDELDLIAYGHSLEQQHGQKKYATLQMIKEELVNNYEELRRPFHVLEEHEVFYLLTGESPETFAIGTVVPITIFKVEKNQWDPQAQPKKVYVKTPSLITGMIEGKYIPRNMELEVQEVAQAAVQWIQVHDFTAGFSLQPREIKNASIKRFPRDKEKWDINAELEDTNKEKEKERQQRAKIRNIQHPLYHNFNFKQAEEYLAPQPVGDCIIRPSSKGSEFLTITWKVGLNLFQHLLVEEIRNKNLKEYKVNGKTYTDLDELIFKHIQATAKKVEEMASHSKFKHGALGEVNDWLESYTKANPRSSAYVFCYDHKHPGSFLLLFKVNMNAKIGVWHVSTGPDGFMLKLHKYSDMMSLCNGFKSLARAEASKNQNSRMSY
ncbi:unnamed protein product [Candida verbasci]|uniref:Transcription elongation factor Spt6 n=1 Tax=Candida verbasci TaxID=1227364 RepID=A0A9W4XC79_9ASCO|nr:unnamed protein product [Candida verbasci]